MVLEGSSEALTKAVHPVLAASRDGGQTRLVVDLEELSAQWSARWPQCRPVGHELRECAPDRWVRFHSLEESKRYPSDADDMAELLHRHNSTVADLVALDSNASAVDADLVVVTCSWSGSAQVTARDQAVTAVDPDAQHWRSVSLGDDDFESWIHLWVSDCKWAHSSLDALFALVANDWTSDVIVCDQRCNWLYHPYDGGADVLAPSEAVRDSLAQRHRLWLSGRPDGL